LQSINDKHEKSKLYSRLPSVSVTLGLPSKNNQTLALLDSGSSLNLISRRYFSELADNKQIKHVFSTNQQLTVANQNKINITCYCYLNVKLQKYSWKQKFYVCDDLAWNLILGLPFLNESKMIMNLNENVICFPYDKNNKINISYVPKTSVQNVNSELQIGNDKYREQILDIVNKHKDVFTDQIGKAIDCEITLKLIDNEIVSLRPYQLNPPALKQMREITDKWLEQGIIQPSLSRYSSPAFLVNKGSKPRLVVNYTKLNSKLEKINFPVGDLHNCYAFLQKAKYFTVLDLSQSFLQLPLAKESQELTTFSTPYESFLFTRIPYGLHCGSGLLSSYMNKVLGPLKFSKALNFIDDTIIFSETEEEHLADIKEVVERFSKHNISVNPLKTKFFFTEISFLGHLVKNGTIQIDPSRTLAIRECKPPKNAKEISRFIGMINFFNRFIPDYAKLCCGLNNLRKKNVKFYWNSELQKDFEQLKYCISNPPVLHIADFNKDFILMTDASDLGIGGCLMQEVDGVRVPIAYHSQKLTQSQTQWSVFERECYAVISSFSKFNQYLQLKPFLLITDNQALAWVLSHKRKLGKLSRWVAQLLSLPFYTEHCKSSDNPVSDCLSRLYSNNECEESCNIPLKDHKSKSSNVQSNVLMEIPLAFTSIKEHQTKDPETVEIINSVNNNTNNLCYYLNKGVLMYRRSVKHNPKIYVPNSLLGMLYQYYHETTLGGHLGYKRTVDKICKHFYHPNLFKEIKQRVRNCELCKFSKPAVRNYQGPLIATHAKSPNERYYIDLVGPLVRSQNSNTMILIIVDDHSKYTWLFPIRDGKSQSVIKKLKEIIFPNYSVCQQIVSDNAQTFASTLFKNFMFQNGIQHRRLSPYRASGNRAERYIRNLKNQLKCFYHNCQTNWDKDLGNLQLSLNTALNDSTGYNAFELMYTFVPNNGLSNIWNIKDLIDTNLNREQIKVKLQNAIQNVKRSVHLNRRGKYDDERIKHPFKIGSRVTIKTHHLSNKFNKFTNKLALRYEGCFRILYFITSVTCLVQDEKDMRNVKKVHIGELKLL